MSILTHALALIVGNLGLLQHLDARIETLPIVSAPVG